MTNVRKTDDKNQIFIVSTFFRAGYREGDTDGMETGHGDGLALDLMVPEDSELGDKISEYLINNFKELNISYII